MDGSKTRSSPNSKTANAKRMNLQNLLIVFSMVLASPLFSKNPNKRRLRQQRFGTQHQKLLYDYVLSTSRCLFDVWLQQLNDSAKSRNLLVLLSQFRITRIKNSATTSPKGIINSRFFSTQNLRSLLHVVDFLHRNPHKIAIINSKKFTYFCIYGYSAARNLRDK